MNSRYFSILAHPSGRLLEEREPYEVDMPRIIEEARQRGCYLELNRQPKRLDLIDTYCQLAKEQGREFYQGNPQDLYPDELELFATKMDEKGWDYGQDDEELLEYAMHPSQYEDARSGKAKEDFKIDLAKRRQAALNVSGGAASPLPKKESEGPKSLIIDVNGEKYNVAIAYPDEPGASTAGKDATKHNGSFASPAETIEILAPLEGRFYLTKDSNEKPLKVGDKVEVGDTIAYIESMKVYNAITADKSGTVAEITGIHGEDIEEDDVIIKLQ